MYTFDRDAQFPQCPRCRKEIKLLTNLKRHVATCFASIKSIHDENDDETAISTYQYQIIHQVLIWIEIY